MLTILLAICIACQSELDYYKNKFDAIYKKTTYISMTFDATLNANTYGRCYNETLTTPAYIVINPVLWKTMDSNHKELVILHELGHCVLKREHKINMFPHGCPRSIMFYYANETMKKCYKEHKMYYQHELVKQ